MVRVQPGTPPPPSRHQRPLRCCAQVYRLSVSTAWYASVPRDEWPDDPDQVALIEKAWDPRAAAEGGQGDRQQVSLEPAR